MFRLDLNTDTKLTIPSAGASRPFLQTYRPSLEWLLDIADGAVPKAMSRRLLNLGGGRTRDHYAAFARGATAAVEFS